MPFLRRFQSGLSHEAEKQTRLVSQIALILVLLASPYFIVFYLMGLTVPAFWVIPSVGLFALTMLFNRLWGYRFAGEWVIASACIILLYYSCVLGKSAGAHYVFFALELLPPIMFRMDERFLMGLGFFMPTFSMLILEWTHYSVFASYVVSLENTRLISMLASGTTISIMVGSALFYLHAKEELAKINQNHAKALEFLNQELKDSNDTLSTTLTKLEKSNIVIQSLGQQASLGAIIRGIAHETKAPMTAIRACCALLLKTENPEGEIKSGLERILGHIDKLADLTKILLRDMGSIVATDTQLNLKEIITQAIKLVDNEAFVKRIKIFTDFPDEFPVTRGSQAYIAQAIMNILMNAIYYTPEAGRIDVSVKIVPGWINLYISDTGPGIAPEVKDSLFEAGVTTATPGGVNAGLGLAFVKRVMDAHHGRIEIQDTSMKGTTFVLAFLTDPSPGEVTPIAPNVGSRL